jgi:hypothetical protein
LPTDRKGLNREREAQLIIRKPFCQMAFTNDGSFYDQFQRMQQQQQLSPEPGEVHAKEQAGPPVFEKGQPFAAAARFSTPQPGYYFGTGDCKGLD